MDGVSTSRYRLWLPVVFGAVAAYLATLEVYSSNALIDSGRIMRTHASNWLDREPGLLLMAINLPGWVLTFPVVLVHGRVMFWVHCLVAVPFIVFWWHLVGRRLDFGLVPRRWLQSGKPVALLPAVGSIGLTALGAVSAIEAVGWFSPHVDSLWSYEAIPRVGFVLWCFLLAAWLGVVAIRIRAQGTGPFDVSAMIIGGLLSNVLVFASLMASEFVLHRHGDADLVIWLVSSAGILPLFRPEAATRIAIVFSYNAVSNACLVALVNYGVFGVEL